MYPDAKIFSITSGSAIMKLNTQLGFEPVSYQDITHDETFWEGCQGCVNYDVLSGKKKCNCLCTAMLFDPVKAAEKACTEEHLRHLPVYLSKAN